MMEQQVPNIAALEQAVSDAQAQLAEAQRQLDMAKQAAGIPAPAPAQAPAPALVQAPAASPAPTAVPAQAPMPAQAPQTYYSATQQSYYVAPTAYQQSQQNQQYQPYQVPNQPSTCQQVPPTTYAVVPPQAAPIPKDHIVAGLLAIFLGCLGIHKFYLGYNTAGIIMLCVSIIGGILTLTFATFAMGLIGLIEGIIYLSKSQYAFEQIYVLHKKEWF